MTRRSLRNRRARFPETYREPPRPAAPAGQVLPPGYRMIEVTPAMRERHSQEGVEIAREVLRDGLETAVVVLLHKDRVVFACMRSSEAAGTIARFLAAAHVAGARREDFRLVIREIVPHVEGDEEVPAFPAEEENER